MRSLSYVGGHLVFCGVFLCAWEAAAAHGFLQPVFFGRPSGIVRYLWQGFVVQRDLWLELGYTLLGATISFVGGSVAAITTGMMFVLLPRVHHAAEPYITFFNAMPRIALAPLFLLWFGLGLGSKIAVGSSLAFFIVLSATIAGIRSVSSDHLTLSRALGATRAQVFFKVTLPSAIPIIFAGLRLGLIFSLLGTVGAELIAAEHGLGQTLAYLQATFSMDGVMAILLLLATMGLCVTIVMNRIERALLSWQ